MAMVNPRKTLCLVETLDFPDDWSYEDRLEVTRLYYALVSKSFTYGSLSSESNPILGRLIHKPVKK